MKPETFVNDLEFRDTQIWDLKYISTSDEEDNDSESSESSEESSSDDEKKTSQKPPSIIDDTVKPDDKDDRDLLDADGKVDPKKIWKLSPGKNESVP